MKFKLFSKITFLGLITNALLSSAWAEDDFASYDRDIPQSYSKVKVSVNNQFSLNPYPVRAETVYDLGRELQQLAPDSSRGLQSISKLSLNVDWKINSRQAFNYCELYDVKIESQSIFTQPQWMPGDDVAEEDLDKWDNFLSAITEYQDLNKQVVARQLDKFASAIKKVKPQKLCSELEDTINNLGTKYLKNAGFELNALAQETASGSIIRDLEYPDFFSNKKDISLNNDAQVEAKVKDNKNIKK